jgi:hypothetical protein
MAVVDIVCLLKDGRRAGGMGDVGEAEHERERAEHLRRRQSA